MTEKMITAAPVRDRLALAKMRLERLKSAHREGVEVEDRELAAAKIEVVRLQAEALEERLPERARRYAAVRSRTVDEILADPSLAKPGRVAVETEEVWTFDNARHLSVVTTRQDDYSDALPQRISDLACEAISDVLSGIGETGTAVREVETQGRFSWRVPYQGGDLWIPEIAFAGCRYLSDAHRIAMDFTEAFRQGQMREREISQNVPGRSPSSLDRAFAPYAAVEALIAAAVPPGTPITRACAGGDLGWRIGRGWLSVEGTDASRPDQIRACAQSLAAIPAPAYLKPRNGDPELVEKVLAAGRAM